ncbi:MAG: YcxB family protein [Streptococcus sp.]|nr:YcxB family protein [Streptococcus sp.]
MNETQPLYTAETTMTLDIYKKSALALSKKKLCRLLIAIGLMFVGLSLTLIRTDQLILGLISLILSVIFPILIYYSSIRDIKKQYKYSKIIAGKTYYYQFYEDNTVITLSSSTATIAYEEFYQVVLTPEAIYLMINSKQFYTIEKQHSSEGLEKFLIEKSSLFSAKKKIIHVQ